MVSILQKILFFSNIKSCIIGRLMSHVKVCKHGSAGYFLFTNRKTQIDLNIWIVMS